MGVRYEYEYGKGYEFEHSLEWYKENNRYFERCESLNDGKKSIDKALLEIPPDVFPLILTNENKREWEFFSLKKSCYVCLTKW